MIFSYFKNHFVKVSQPNNQQRVDYLVHVFQTEYNEEVSSHKNCSCSDYKITLENVLDATFSLKKGKCSDDSKQNAEHYFNARLHLFDHIQVLFQGMLDHGFVPHQFQ